MALFSVQLAWCLVLTSPALTSEGMVGTPSCRLSADDQDLAELNRALDTLSGPEKPEMLLDHPTIRRLVVRQSGAVPHLLDYLKRGANPAGRLAACVILRHTGYAHMLVDGTEDADARVRAYARAILVNRPRTPGDDSSAAVPYEIDLMEVDQLKGLLAGSVRLSPVEQRDWMRKLASESGKPDDPSTSPFSYTPQFIAKRVLSERPLDVADYVDEIVRDSQDPASRAAALRVLSEVAECLFHDPRSADQRSRSALLEKIQATVELSLTAGIEERNQATRLKLLLLPPKEAAGFCAEILSRSDPDLRRIAAARVELLATLLAESGETAEAENLLGALTTSIEAESDGSVKSWLQAVRDRAFRSSQRIELLVTRGHRVINPVTGQVDRIIRYICADGELIDVSEDEYRFITERTGGPYLSRERFVSLRNEYLSSIGPLGSIDRTSGGQGQMDAKADMQSDAKPTSPQRGERGDASPNVRFFWPIAFAVVMLACLLFISTRAKR